MPTLLTILAALANVVGILATLLILVMCMAGGANSTPQQIRTLKLIMLASALVCVICVTVSIWCLIAGRPGLGALLAALPTLLSISIVAVMLWTEF
jgi:hypothetical protein